MSPISTLKSAAFLLEWSFHPRSTFIDYGARLPSLTFTSADQPGVLLKYRREFIDLPSRGAAEVSDCEDAWRDPKRL